MAKFALENSYFKFNRDIKKQIPGTTIGTKFAKPYPCIFMEYFEKSLLESQNVGPFHGLDMSMIFLSAYTVKKALKNFFMTFVNSLKTLNLHMNSENKMSPFSNLDIKFFNGNLTTDLHIEKR